MKKIFFFTVLASMVLASCKKQSELDIDDIQGSATIKGQVTYTAYTANGNDYIFAPVSASGVTVVAYVAYSSYDNIAPASKGEKQFEVVTDENGNYELSIPVGQNAIVVNVQPRDFETSYNKMVNSSLVATTARFSAESQSVSVQNNDVKVLDIKMEATDVADLTTRNQEVTITGKLLVPVEKAKLDDNKETNGSEKSTTIAKCKVCITITNSGSTEKLIYNNISLNEEGYYTLKAKLYDEWELSSTIVTVAPQSSYRDDEFPHYYYNFASDKWLKQSISVIYQGGSGSVSATTNLSDNYKLMDCKISDIVMRFRLVDSSTIRGIGNPEVDYDQNDYTRLYRSDNPFDFSYQYDGTYRY